MQQREATCTGFASPGCATPSDFLSLLASCSSRGLPALFRAGSALGLLPSEVCSSHAAGKTFRPACPSWRCPDRMVRNETPRFHGGHPPAVPVRPPVSAVPNVSWRPVHLGPGRSGFEGRRKAGRARGPGVACCSRNSCRGSGTIPAFADALAGATRARSAHRSTLGSPGHPLADRCGRVPWPPKRNGNQPNVGRLDDATTKTPRTVSPSPRNE
jgi:hypothetical protein